MNHGALVDYYANLLSIISTKDFSDLQPCPNFTFRQRLDAGKYKELDPRELKSVERAVNELGMLWGGEPNITTGELIRRSFEEAELDGSDLRVIAKRFAGAYERAHGMRSGGSEVSAKLGFDLPAGSEAPRKERERACDHVRAADMSAFQIYQELGRTVWGQDEARRAMAMLLWNHMHGKRRIALFVGPTGSGKSHLVHAARGIYHNVVEVNGAQLTAEGWQGDVKLSSMFRGMSASDAEHAIVVIDEADKLFEPKHGSGGDDHSLLTQNELLKFLEEEGTTKVYLGNDPRVKNPKAESISCGHMSFIFLGSFETMLQAKNVRKSVNGVGFGGSVHSQREVGYRDGFTTEDLVRHANVRREIAGRIGRIVQLRPLTADDYLHIIEDPEKSPALRLEAEYGMSLGLTDADKAALAKAAVDSKMGVRYITRRLEDRMDDLVFGCDAPAASM